MNTIKEFVHPHLGIRLDIKIVVIAAILLFVGVALILYSLDLQSAQKELPVALLGAGVVSAILAIVLYFTKARALYFLPTESKIEHTSLHFEAEHLPVLKELCESGRLNAKSLITSKEIGNVRLDILKASDNTFAAVQVYQYQDLMYVAQSSVRTLNVSEVEDLLKHIKL